MQLRVGPGLSGFVAWIPPAIGRPVFVLVSSGRGRPWQAPRSACQCPGIKGVPLEGTLPVALGLRPWGLRPAESQTLTSLVPVGFPVVGV